MSVHPMINITLGKTTDQRPWVLISDYGLAGDEY